jgi:hypothetical protein
MADRVLLSHKPIGHNLIFEYLMVDFFFLIISRIRLSSNFKLNNYVLI